MDYTIPPALNDKGIRASYDPSFVDFHVECYRDIGVFAKAWMPDRFPMAYTPIHDQIIDAINDTLAEQQRALAVGRFAGRKLAIEGCRGSAKTSFVTQALAARQGIYSQSRFIPIIQKSESKCIIETDNLRQWFETSPRVLAAYRNEGIEDVKGHVGEAGESWGKKGFTIRGLFGGRTFYLPRGPGQPIRGLSFGMEGHRPDCIILDDFDDEVDWLRNEEIRKKYHNEWFPGAVLKCVQQFEAMNVPWLIVYVDSCKGDMALIETLLDHEKSPSWEGIRIQACDEQWNTLCPEFLSQETIEREKVEYEARGELDVLARELMSMPMAGENKPFPMQLFKPYPSAMAFDPFQGFNAVMVDPARTENPKSSDTAIVGVTADLQAPAIFVRHAIGEKFGVDEMVDTAIDVALDINASVIAIEYAGLHMHIEKSFREGLVRRRCNHIELLELKPQMGKGEQSGYEPGKRARIIWSLRPWYKWGIVFHNPNLYTPPMGGQPFPMCKRLEHQLHMLPKRKDIADALAYFKQVLFHYGIEFDAPAEAPAVLGRPLPPHRQQTNRLTLTLEELVAHQEASNILRFRNFDTEDLPDTLFRDIGHIDLEDIPYASHY